MQDVVIIIFKVGQENEKSNSWWQGSKSPFSDGATQSQGARPRQRVVGCSGDGCSSPLFSAPAPAAASSKSQGTRATPIKEPTVPMISSASTTCRAPMVSFLRMEIGATPHKNHPSRR